MKKLEKQQERTAKLLKLVSENPELEIIPMVDGDIGGDEWGRYMSSWGDCEVDYYYCPDERVYLKSHDFEELVDEFMDNNFEEDEYKNVSNENLQKIAESKVNDYEWVKAIIVSIDTN